MNILMHLLTVLFVGLKLTGYIAWPWLGVFAPSLIVLTLALVIWVSVFALVIWATTPRY